MCVSITFELFELGTPFSGTNMFTEYPGFKYQGCGVKVEAEQASFSCIQVTLWSHWGWAIEFSHPDFLMNTMNSAGNFCSYLNKISKMC